jgi:Flp pilus assembly CpaE family ATPase
VERLPLVLALTPLAERAVEEVLFGRDSLVEVVASVADAGELEREAGTSGAQSALVSPDLSGLTAAFCARVRACGIRVVGLAGDTRQRRQLQALGVDEIVEPTDSDEAFLSALRGPAELVPWTDEEYGDAQDSVSPANAGSVLTVIGSKGAPGASECASSLAALAAERWPTVLVEVDAIGGGLDLRLGADPRRGSLLGLARAVAQDDRALAELMERWLVEREGWSATLVGAPEPMHVLDEVARPGTVAAAVRALASLRPLVVADTGFLLFEGHEASPACRVHREAVVTADAVLLVIGAREEQLRAGLDQLDALLELDIAPERLRVALNGAGGPGATSSARLDSLLQAQLAERGLVLDAWLAWDGRALTRAQRTGRTLAMARRRGPYSRALARLLDEMFLPAVPVSRGRKPRLAPPSADALERAEEVVA